MAKTLTTKAFLKIALAVETEARDHLRDCIAFDRIPAEEHASCYHGSIYSILEEMQKSADNCAKRVLTRDEALRVNAILTAAGAFEVKKTIAFETFPKLENGNNDDGAAIVVNGERVGQIVREVQWTRLAGMSERYTSKITGYRLELWKLETESTYASLSEARDAARKAL